MPVKRMESAASQHDSVMEIIQTGSPKEKTLAIWAKDNVEVALTRDHFVYDKMRTSSYPLVLGFMKKSTNLDDAERAMETMALIIKKKFQAGVQTQHNPFVRISERFKISDVYVYCVISMWSNGKLAVYFTT